MLVVSGEQSCFGSQILNYLPKKIRKVMYFADWEELEEIRLRTGIPVVLRYRSGTFFVNDRGRTVSAGDRLLKTTKQEMDEALELISRSSLYAHEHDLKNGYITVDGGCRVGVSGTGVQNGDGVFTIKEISGLNYRIPHEAEHVADRLLDLICDGDRVLNTLIISPPGCGKTTLLRDIVRGLSYRKITVGLLDERGEVASVSNGYPGFDMGYFCDVMTNVPKAEGMLMLLRSMSPQIIATDELGTAQDIRAVKKIINSGVKLVATVHAENREQLCRREELAELAGFFEAFIVLSRRRGAGTVEEAYRVD